MDPEDACDRLIARQRGVISRAQALASGMSRGQVERRVTEGRWRALHPGIYVPRAMPTSWRQRLFAAVLRGGPGAHASHRSAAALWRLDGVEERVLEVSTRTARRIRSVIVHRRPGGDMEVVDRIPVTPIDRTLIDLAAVAPPRSVALALDDALRRGLTTPSRLSRAAERLGSRGRPGMAALRALLVRRDERDVRAESRLESALLEVLRAQGLPVPVAQHPVSDRGRVVARLDFAYPPLRVAIEADGYRWHGGRDRWSRDMRRENALKLLGWTVLRFSWEDVVGRPELVAAQVRGALHSKLSTSSTQGVGD